jgi:hypothetical protein
LNQLLDGNLVVGLSEGGEPDAKEMAGAALYSYNVKQTGLADRRPIAAVAKNPATGETVGGLWGRTELGLLFLDMFFSPKRRGADPWVANCLSWLKQKQGGGAASTLSWKPAPFRHLVSMSATAMRNLAACLSPCPARRACSSAKVWPDAKSPSETGVQKER